MRKKSEGMAWREIVPVAVDGETGELNEQIAGNEAHQAVADDFN